MACAVIEDNCFLEVWWLEVIKEISVGSHQGCKHPVVNNPYTSIVLLGEVTDEKLVSIDFNHNPISAIVDLSLTSVVGTKMGKVSAWYDNEWGFASRMCDLVEYIHKI